MKYTRMAFFVLILAVVVPVAYSRPYCEEGKQYHGSILPKVFTLTGVAYVNNQTGWVDCEISIETPEGTAVYNMPSQLVDVLFTLEDFDLPSDRTEIGTMYVSMFQQAKGRILYFNNESPPDAYEKPSTGINLGLMYLYDEEIPYRVLVYLDGLKQTYGVFESGAVYRLMGVPSGMTFA